MLTQKEFIVPERAATWERSYDDLVRAIKDHFAALNRPGALEIFEATITADDGIIFPSGTLDDYEPDGSWTPTITAGTGTFTTVSATGTYHRIGNLYLYRVAITITTNGTAATDVRFTTPFTSAGVEPFAGFETASGIVLGGYLNGTTGLVYKYDSTYPGADGRTLVIRGAAKV